MPKKRPNVTKHAVDKCHTCGGACCKYITVHLPTPVSITDFDGLLWQMSHKGVHVFKDSDGWQLLVLTPCRYLKRNNRCAVYETRPNVCRDHESDYCEYDEAVENSAVHYFKSAEELDTYCSKRFKRWKMRFTT